MMWWCTNYTDLRTAAHGSMLGRFCGRFWCRGPIGKLASGITCAVADDGWGLGTWRRGVGFGSDLGNGSGAYSDWMGSELGNNLDSWNLTWDTIQMQSEWIWIETQIGCIRAINIAKISKFQCFLLRTQRLKFRNNNFKGFNDCKCKLQPNNCNNKWRGRDPVLLVLL